MRSIVRCARPSSAGVDIPARCDRCDEKVRWSTGGQATYRHVGHPWATGRADQWWCVPCLRASGHDVESYCDHLGPLGPPAEPEPAEPLQLALI